MFVHPQPGFRVLADVRFENVPASLSDFFVAGIFGKFERFESAQLIGSVRAGCAKTRDDGQIGATGKAGVQGGDAGLATKAANHRGRATGLDCQVGEEGGVASGLEVFQKAQHGAALWNDGVASRFAVGFEDIGQQGVFEILSDDGEIVIAQPHYQHSPFEVAIVRGDPDGAGFTGGLDLRLVIHLNVTVFQVTDSGDARCPELIEDGAGEILKSTPGDLSAFAVRVTIAEYHTQILDGSSAAALVCVKCDRAETSGGCHQ